MRDRIARYTAAAALALAISGAGGYAFADATTEPDAAVVSEQVFELQDQVASLQDDIDNLYANDDVLDGRTVLLDCLAYSDYHYYKERIGKSKKRYRLPVVVWNASDQSCRTTKQEWKPKRRALLKLETGRK